MNVHFEEFPFLSVTVKVIGKVETDALIIVPTGIFWVVFPVLKPQASLLFTLNVKSVIVFVQFDPFAIVVSPKQVITGGVTSFTVTTEVQVELFPLASVTVKVTVFVAPTLLQSKVVLFRDKVTGEQLSEDPLSTIEGVIVTLPLASRLTDIGLQLAVGGVWSTILSVKLVWLTFPQASVACIIIVLVPPYPITNDPG